MRRLGVALVLLAGFAVVPATAGAAELGSAGCQAMNAFVDGSTAGSPLEFVADFEAGELVEATAEFGIGGMVMVIAGRDVSGDWHDHGAYGNGGDTSPTVSWVIAAPDTHGIRFYFESLATPVWTVSCLPVGGPTDTDGDGFWDHEDNFPDTYSKCREVQATIIGTGGADNPLNGTSGPDVIMGLGGGDVIYGLEGDDLICAGNGADTVYGGDGKDKIYGDNGADLIYGNAKSDRLYGGDNDDVILGGDGTRDRLYGGAGVNDLDGGAGDDDRCTLGPTFNRCETVVAGNQPPVVAGISGVLSYTGGEPAKPIAATATVEDVDSADFALGVLTVGLTGDDALDVLSISPGGLITSTTGGSLKVGDAPAVTIGFWSYDSEARELSVTFSSTGATASVVQDVIRGITFQNLSITPTTGERTAQFVLTDGDGGTSSPVTRAIDVSQV